MTPRRGFRATFAVPVVVAIATCRAPIRGEIRQHEATCLRSPASLIHPAAVFPDSQPRVTWLFLLDPRVRRAEEPGVWRRAIVAHPQEGSRSYEGRWATQVDSIRVVWEADGTRGTLTLSRVPPTLSGSGRLERYTSPPIGRDWTVAFVIDQCAGAPQVARRSVIPR